MPRSTSKPPSRALLRLSAIFVVSLLPIIGGAAAPPPKFERTYAPQGEAHLTLTNINGEINVAAWDKKTITVRAVADPSVAIRDAVTGNEIEINVKPSLRPGRASFSVFVPPGTSISLNNMMGRIDVQGVNGHIRINSFDSDVNLANVKAPSVEVKVTSGDIHFDGDLHSGGSYRLQSVKGDIDVSLPAATPFNLTAQAFSEQINLGDFLSSLSGLTRGSKRLSGTHLRGGAMLTLTTYTGRILFHRK